MHDFDRYRTMVGNRLSSDSDQLKKLPVLRATSLQPPYHSHGSTPVDTGGA